MDAAPPSEASDDPAVEAPATAPPLVAVVVAHDPGDWFECLRDKRLPTGPGREWTMPGWEAPRKLRVDVA